MKKLCNLVTGILFAMFLVFMSNNVVAADAYDYSEIIHYNPLYEDFQEQKAPVLPQFLEEILL